MKLLSSKLRSSLLFPVVVLAIPLISSAPRAAAQANAQSTSAVQAQPSAVPARITQAIDETQLVRLKGNVHPLARPEFDQGAAQDSTPMNRMLLVLQRSPEQQAALQKLMEEQLTKDSPNYHNWLTPQQFGTQFGPAEADIQTVTDWLTGHGFRGIKVSAGRTVIEFSGNAAQVRNAFHTEIHRYLVNGEARQANVADPQIPAALTPVVAGIVSLHNFPRNSMIRKAGPVFGNKESAVKPQFTTSGGLYLVGPADFAKIYNLPPTTTLSGTGVTIAIVAISNINPNDVVDFENLFGFSTNFTASNIILNGPDPGFDVGGAESEADLDVQVASMVAPGATIKLVVSEPTLTSEGTDLSALYIVDNNMADVLNESFGACEAALGANENVFLNALWEQAAAQGISVMVSAGDNGSAGCDDFNTQATAIRGLAVSGVASTAFNVAVGGTDFDDVGKQANFWSTTNAATTRESVLGYIPEVPWNDSCAAAATSANLNTVCASANGISAASGGPSSIYTKPSWQSAITPTDSHRDLPDVSLFSSVGSASNSAYLLCEADALSPGSPPSCASSGQFAFFRAGGTSASSPAFAGIMALINQQQGGRQGNPNPVLYKIASTAANSCNSSTQPLSPPATCIFYDVTKGNNSVPCAANSPAGTSPNCSSTTAGVIGVLVDPAHPTTPGWTAGTGYDTASGLGSVNVTNLAAAWKTAVGAFKATTAATKINAGTSQVTITHGQTVTLSATVTSASGTPTGDVSFIAPTTVNGGLGPATLSGGTATLTSPSSVAFALPGGSYNLKAHYAGDGTFAPSDDPTGVPVVVNKEVSKLQVGIVTFDVFGNVITDNATSFAYGSAYIFRMDILNSTGTTSNCRPLLGGATTGCAVDATGTVTVTDNGSPLTCSPLVPGCTSPFPVNSEGSAEDQPIQLTGGTHTLSATYSGDISYSAPASATTDTVTVTPATTAIALGASQTTGVTTTTPVTFNATISSASNSVTGTTGTVTFFNNGTSIGTATVTSVAASSVGAGGTATFTNTFTTAGTESITASYGGDTNYGASGPSSPPISITVTTASTNPSITSLSPTSGPVGTSVTITGTNFGTMQGTSTVTFNGTAATQVTWSTTGTSITAVVPTGATTGPVVVTVGGVASNGVTFTVSTTGSFTVSGTAATITAISGSAITTGSTITVTPSGGFTGMVNITCPSTGLPPGVTCPNPPTITVPNGLGTLMITLAAPSSTTSASIIPADRKMYWAGLAPTTPGGKGWWGLGAGTGLAAIVLLLVPGRKRYRAALGLGLVCLLSFSLGCSSGYGGGGGTSPTTTKISVMSTKAAQGTVNLTVTVTPTSTGARIPTGYVQLYDGTSTLGAQMTLSNGSATIPTSTLAVGTHTMISAHYLGDSYSQVSQSGTLSIAITGTTSVGITGTSGSTTANGTINLTIN